MVIIIPLYSRCLHRPTFKMSMDLRVQSVPTERFVRFRYSGLSRCKIASFAILQISLDHFVLGEKKYCVVRIRRPSGRRCLMSLLVIE